PARAETRGGAAAPHPADPGDATARDADVGAIALRLRSVDDDPVLQDDVELGHRRPPSGCGSMPAHYPIRVPRSRESGTSPGIGVAPAEDVPLQRAPQKRYLSPRPGRYPVPSRGGTETLRPGGFRIDAARGGESGKEPNVSQSFD